MPDRSTWAQETDFAAMRRAGVPIERAAEYVGRKRSWGYQQERTRLHREEGWSESRNGGPVATLERRSSASPKPAQNLSTVVDILLSFRRDDPERFLEIIETYDFLDLLCSMADLCLFTSSLYVRDYLAPSVQKGGEMTADEIAEADAELAEAGADDLDLFLGGIPIIMDRHLRGESLVENPVALSKGAPPLDEGYREWLVSGEPEPATTNGNGNGNHNH